MIKEKCKSLKKKTQLKHKNTWCLAKNNLRW
jgi:hypothetical protein